jgi:hypothetical protein
MFVFVANQGWNISQFRVIGAYLQSPTRERQNENIAVCTPPVREYATGDLALLSVFFLNSHM